MELEVMKQIRISAMHILPLHAGKCSNVHGHNYLVQAFACGEVDATSGMIIDFGELESILQRVVGKFDHTALNWLHAGVWHSMLGESIQTTAENLARAFLYDLHEKCSVVRAVRVWETDDCYAEARL